MNITFNTKLFREDLIKKRMIKLDISMQEASDEIGISKATYSRIESGKPPDMETFLKVLNWLNKTSGEYIRVVQFVVK